MDHSTIIDSSSDSSNCSDNANNGSANDEVERLSGQGRLHRIANPECNGTSAEDPICIVESSSHSEDEEGSERNFHVNKKFANLRDENYVYPPPRRGTPPAADVSDDPVTRRIENEEAELRHDLEKLLRMEDDRFNNFGDQYRPNYSPRYYERKDVRCLIELVVGRNIPWLEDFFSSLASTYWKSGDDDGDEEEDYIAPSLPKRNKSTTVYCEESSSEIYNFWRKPPWTWGRSVEYFEGEDGELRYTSKHSSFSPIENKEERTNNSKECRMDQLMDARKASREGMEDISEASVDTVKTLGTNQLRKRTEGKQEDGYCSESVDGVIEEPIKAVMHCNANLYDLCRDDDKEVNCIDSIQSKKDGEDFNLKQCVNATAGSKRPSNQMPRDCKANQKLKLPEV